MVISYDVLRDMFVWVVIVWHFGPDRFHAEEGRGREGW